MRCELPDQTGNSPWPPPQTLCPSSESAHRRSLAGAQQCTTYRNLDPCTGAFNGDKALARWEANEGGGMALMPPLWDLRKGSKTHQVVMVVVPKFPLSYPLAQPGATSSLQLEAVRFLTESRTPVVMCYHRPLLPLSVWFLYCFSFETPSA
ncbi:hypothetical protein QR685DRAFT_437963 [Neurospora intermedia]|uniref:Uncharacterized protein n=1 Tax=Neurospora intermedia TaxID=5142 RepID=A0ABR3DHY3_NEUIN